MAGRFHGKMEPWIRTGGHDTSKSITSTFPVLCWLRQNTYERCYWCYSNPFKPIQTRSNPFISIQTHSNPFMSIFCAPFTCLPMFFLGLNRLSATFLYRQQLRRTPLGAQRDCQLQTRPGVAHIAPKNVENSWFPVENDPHMVGFVYLCSFTRG